jgi:hypothetical protein
MVMQQITKLKTIFNVTPPKAPGITVPDCYSPPLTT